MTKDQQLGYSVGYLLGKDMMSKGFHTLPVQDVMEGLDDALAEATPKIAPEEAGRIFKEAYAQNRSVLCAKNKEIAEAFKNNWVSKEGSLVMDIGIVYDRIKPGNGQQPGPEDNVRVHYKASFLNEQIFDSSDKFDNGAIIDLGATLAGLQFLIRVMRVGERRKALIPSHLAYGDEGVAQWIPPGAALIYDIELIEIL